METSCVFGAGPSQSTLLFPRSSLPVTTRRIGFSPSAMLFLSLFIPLRRRLLSADCRRDPSTLCLDGAVRHHVDDSRPTGRERLFERAPDVAGFFHANAEAP